MFSKTLINTITDNCVDTDEGATNTLGYGCNEYSQNMCGLFDKYHHTYRRRFDSQSMCCICGGGGSEYNVLIKNVF